MNSTVLVVIDGLRSDAIAEAHTPALDFLMGNGAHCMNGQTVEPSLTLPAHFSIFTSLAPYSHGVTTNTAMPDMSAAGQSLFTHIKYHGGSTAAFFSWDHLRNLSFPGNLDFSFFQRVADEQNLMAQAREASRHLTRQKPDFAFVYLEWADIVGHIHGWMSREYLKAVEACDKALEIIVKAVQESKILVISDHGGRGIHHKTDHPDIMTIPFIAWGKDIRQDIVLDRKVSVMDVAPTLAYLMDIPGHPDWQGSTITEIHSPPAKGVPMIHIG